MRNRNLKQLNANSYDEWVHITQNELKDMDEKDKLNLTMMDFQRVFDVMKQEAPSYRIKSLYGYDIQDHPDFVKSQKIIRRIINFTGKPMNYV